jgi:acyl dehydratase
MDGARRYYEDLPVGFRFGGESYTVPRREMIAFAERWDPRPIHLDDAAGQAAGFGCAIASGAYTTAIFTLLSVRARTKSGDQAILAGLGSEIKLRAVRAGDTLTYDAEIVGRRESRSLPHAGIVETRAILTNQHGEEAYETTTTTLVLKRPQPGQEETG